MESKIRLTEKDVCDYYRLDDEVFVVHFCNVPQSLFVEYGGDAIVNNHICAEFWEDQGEFHYFIKVNGEIYDVSKHIDYRTNWIVRILSFEED